MDLPPPTAPPLTPGTVTPITRTPVRPTAPPLTPAVVTPPTEEMKVRRVIVVYIRRRYEITIEPEAPEVGKIEEELIRRKVEIPPRVEEIVEAEEKPTTPASVEFVKQLDVSVRNVFTAYKRWIDHAQALLSLSGDPNVKYPSDSMQIVEYLAPSGTSSLNQFVIKPKRLLDPTETPFYEDGGRFGFGLTGWRHSEHDSSVFTSAFGVTLYDELVNDPLAEREIASQLHLLWRDIPEFDQTQFGPVKFDVDGLLLSVPNSQYRELVVRRAELKKKFENLPIDVFFATPQDNEGKLSFLQKIHREYYLKLFDTQVRNWYYTVILALGRVLDKQRWASRPESTFTKITKAFDERFKSGQDQFDRVGKKIMKELTSSTYSAEYDQMVDRNNKSSTDSARDIIFRVVYERVLKEVIEKAHHEVRKVLHIKEYTDVELKSMFLRWIRIKVHLIDHYQDFKYLIPEMQTLEDILRLYEMDFEYAGYGVTNDAQSPDVDSLLQSDINKLKLSQRAPLKIPLEESRLAYMFYDGLRKRTLDRIQSIQRDDRLLHTFMESQILSMIRIMMHESVDPLIGGSDVKLTLNAEERDVVSNFNSRYDAAASDTEQLELLMGYVNLLVSLKQKTIFGPVIRNNLERGLSVSRASPQESMILLLMCGSSSANNSNVWSFLTENVEKNIIEKSGLSQGDAGFGALRGMVSDCFNLARRVITDRFSVVGVAAPVEDARFDLWISDKSISRPLQLQILGQDTVTQAGLILSLLDEQISKTKKTLTKPLLLEADRETMHVLDSTYFDMKNTTLASNIGTARVKWKCNVAIVERNVPNGSPPMAEYRDLDLYEEEFRNIGPSEKQRVVLDWNKVKKVYSFVGGKVWAQVSVDFNEPDGSDVAVKYETPRVRLELYDKCVRSLQRFSWTRSALNLVPCMNWNLNLHNHRNSSEGVKFNGAIVFVNKDDLKEYMGAFALDIAGRYPVVPNKNLIDEIVGKVFRSKGASLNRILNNRMEYAVYYLDHIVYLASQRIKKLEKEMQTDREIYESRKYTSAQVPLEYQSTTAYGALCQELAFAKSAHSFLETAWKWFYDNAWCAPVKAQTPQGFLKNLEVRQEALEVKFNQLDSLCTISAKQAKQRNGNKLDCHYSLLNEEYSGKSEIHAAAARGKCTVRYCGAPNTVTKVPDPHYVVFYSENGEELSLGQVDSFDAEIGNTHVYLPHKIFYYKGSYIVDNVEQQKIMDGLERMIMEYNRLDRTEKLYRFEQTLSNIKKYIDFISKALYS